MMQITPCEDCDNVHAATRKQTYTQWQCIKFPKIRGLNPVAPEAWIDPPYNRCVNINLGHCPLFTPRREADFNRSDDVFTSPDRI